MSVEVRSHLLDDIPELDGLPEDEIRYYRLIDEREPDAGGEKITLACGHTLRIAGLPEMQHYILCMQCMQGYRDAERELGERRQQDADEKKLKERAKAAIETFRFPSD
jgi:hypothetical protein